MKQDNLEKIITEVNSVRVRDKVIPLVYTGVKNSGGFTSAFEFSNQETEEKYFLKVSEIAEGSKDEISILTKVNLLFKNEILSEPDAAKRLNYMPVPDVLTDDIDKFNVEFMRMLDRNRFTVQLQTAGKGIPCEKQLPDSLKDRVAIALDFAKILRTCAKNKIAYVDIKPLEHLFWSKTEDKISVTLIDWGNSRQNASSFLLLDDIRKFCLFLPELIYGRKMLEVINQGKYEYPIQKENNPILIRLLGQLSFNTDNPPLNQKYALLIGDMLAGNLTEVRVQNKCVEIWDDILRALNEAVDSLMTETKTTVLSYESLKKEAENFIQKDPESFMDKDFRKAMDPRLISLASYKGWLLPVIRTVQFWYGKVDLIPQQGFDVCIRFVLNDQTTALNSEFQKLAKLISEKISRTKSCPELIPILQDHLKQIQDVIYVWDFLAQSESGQISPEMFQAAFTTSNLRVVDPFLADAYRKQARHISENSVPVSSQNNKVIKPDSLSEETEDSKMENLEDHTTEIKKRTQPLLDVFSRANSFSELRNIGFFADLNELLSGTKGEDSLLVEKELEPVFLKMLDETEDWINKVGPDRFVVPDDQLNSLDWSAVLPQAVADIRVIVKNNPIQIGEFIRSHMFNLQNDLARASSASIELNQKLPVRDLLPRIKALRKKLDTENMEQFKALIENGDFEAAKEIIDLHYIEYPAFYERLRTEMSRQQDEGEDKKALALINSLLNDLSTASGNIETGKYLRNQNNIPYVHQKISSFRQKNMQLYDIQDELARTKNLANESRKASKDLQRLTTLNLVLLVVVIVLSVTLLTVVLIKNFNLDRNVARLEANLSNFQKTYIAAEQATPIPTQPPLPTATIEITPTEMPIAVAPLITDTEAVPAAQLTEDALLSPADLHLKSLIGKDVVFNLDGNVDLYGDELMTPEKKLGVVINYVQNVPGKLIGYTDKMVNLEIPFNIGKSQISASTMQNVARQTNIRQYSETPSGTPPVFISQTEIVLTAPATNCGATAESFCNGTISVWIPREKIETSIK